MEPERESSTGARRADARRCAEPRARTGAVLTALALLLAALPARSESSEWILDAELDVPYTSNLNRARSGSEAEPDVSFQPALTFGRAFQLAARTRMLSTARLGGEIYTRTEDLDAFEADGQLALVHKFGLGDAPWARVSLGGGYHYLDVRDRRGPRFAIGAEIGQRLSPRLDGRIGYSYERRFGGDGREVAVGVGDDVFDQQVHRITADGRFLITRRLLFTGGFTYRRGDFDSNVRTGRASLLGRGGVEAVAQDGVFGGWVYRIDGNGYAPFAGLSHGLTDRWSLDLGYRFEYGEADSPPIPESRRARRRAIPVLIREVAMRTRKQRARRAALAALNASCFLSILPAAGETLRAAVVDAAGEPVRDAVVQALPLDGTAADPPVSAPVEIDQVDKEYVPYVTAVRVGTRVTFPNRDQIRHHVSLVLRGQDLRDPALRGHPGGARRVRQARRGGARLQHPRLDAGLRVRLRDALLRRDRRRGHGGARASGGRLLGSGLASASSRASPQRMRSGLPPEPPVSPRFASRSNASACGSRGERPRRAIRATADRAFRWS